MEDPTPAHTHVDDVYDTSSRGRSGGPHLVACSATPPASSPARSSTSGFRPDIILAIARGGLTVAGALGYALGIKNCFAISVEYYTGVDERLDVPVVLPPMPDLIAVRDLNVLIADDVADTGDTLSMVDKIIQPHVREARSAVLYAKSRSIIVPTYTWRRTDAWITFPGRPTSRSSVPSRPAAEDRAHRAGRRRVHHRAVRRGIAGAACPGRSRCRASGRVRA